ncbi:MAG: S41 family peptidase [Bacteroidota bacterium]
MRKITLIVVALLSSFSCSLAQKADNFSFTSKQVMNFYQTMIEEIEAIDTEAIAVRNSKKKVSWKEYKEYHEAQFKMIKTDQAFKTKFHAFARGFSNGHSRFRFHFPTQNVQKKPKKISIEIGYTFPETSFFDLASKKTITHINGQAIEQVFKHFEDYEVSANTTIRSQFYFKRRLESGQLMIDGKIAENLTFEDGSQSKIAYEAVTNQDDPLAAYYGKIEVKHYEDWKRVAVGYKVALLQKENIALIKIKNFIYPNRSKHGLRCEGSDAPDSTQCADIQLLRKALIDIDEKVDYLIFDLQNNPGGNENSVFLAEFCPKPFMDLAVEYRKVPFLEDDYLRSYIFYGSKRAEKWFKELKANGIYAKTEEGAFLPARADFCQGAKNCALVSIRPNYADAYHFKKYYVLINEATASSGDDFTYRMKDFGNATIAGQTQAADLTYATINIIFYQDKAGTIQRIYGDGKIEGVIIAEITIPLSRSVDENGKMLQGNPLLLDIPVHLTKENFEQREESVLGAVLVDIEKQEN